jgi:hypothetical protein
MSVFSLRPRVADLVFQLYARPLHPELFETLAFRKIQREEYGLTVRITRSGHVFTWQHRDQFLTEVTAARSDPLPDKRRLMSYRMRGERSDKLTCLCGFNYQTSFQVEVLPPEVYYHVHDEILTDGSKRGLLHNFQPNHRLSLAPLGHVALEAGADFLLLTAFHTFPEEHTVVKSQSLLERMR